MKTAYTDTLLKRYNLLVKKLKETFEQYDGQSISKKIKI